MSSHPNHRRGHGRLRLNEAKHVEIRTPKTRKAVR